MPDPIPDPLATHLDEVRKRAALTKPSAHGYTPRGEQLPGGPADDWLIANLEAAADVPRLLAAVEAVLKPHQRGPIVILGALCPRHENHRYFSITAVEAADVIACPECTATVRDSCAYCGPQVPREACPVRAAISRALLGEGGAS